MWLASPNHWLCYVPALPPKGFAQPGTHWPCLRHLRLRCPHGEGTPLCLALAPRSATGWSGWVRIAPCGGLRRERAAPAPSTAEGIRANPRNTYIGRRGGWQRGRITCHTNWHVTCLLSL